MLFLILIICLAVAILKKLMKKVGVSKNMIVLAHGEYTDGKHFIVPQGLTLIFPCKLGNYWNVNKQDAKLFNSLKDKDELEIDTFLNNLINETPKKGIFKNQIVYHGGDICANLQICMPIKDNIRHGVYSLPFYPNFRIHLSRLEKLLSLNSYGSLFTFSGSLKNFVKRFDSKEDKILVIVTCRSQKNNFDHYAVRCVEECYRNQRSKFS